MCKTLRLLLATVTCCFSAIVVAQSTVNVELQGLSTELAKNVRLFLGIEQQKDHPLLSEGRLQRLHKKAPQEIANALQPFGYYRPTIHGSLNQAASGEWLASYVIDPGPPLPIAEFDFKVSGEIESDPQLPSLLESIPLTPGDTFNHQIYENIKTELAKFAIERGYFDARFVKHEVAIDLQRYQARIQLHYHSGPRYRFGELLMEQAVLSPQLLQRYIPFERGTAYSLNALLELQQALNDSDYFHNVEVSPGDPQPASREVPIKVLLTARKPHRYTLGLGYGTDTGARAKFGWEMPRLNPSGHRFDTEVKRSQIGYSLTARYRIPVLDPRTDQFIYSAGVINEKTDTSESTINTVGISLNRGRGLWRESMSLNYQHEEYAVADDRGTSTLLMPGISWTRTWGGNIIFALEGLRFDISLRGASDQLVSDTSFAQLKGGIKAIESLGKHNRLIARGSLGRSWTKDFQELPSSVRFFAGGSQSVRGYAFQSLGPEDENGEVVGGKHLMVGSIELEHRFTERWGAALFYDAGNAIDHLDDKLERGAGLGLRWQTPVGPVRLDVARALTQEGRPWRLHINIGPDL
jgi:translocation and assembly module TamA